VRSLSLVLLLLNLAMMRRFSYVISLVSSSQERSKAYESNNWTWSCLHGGWCVSDFVRLGWNVTLAREHIHNLDTYFQSIRHFIRFQEVPILCSKLVLLCDLRCYLCSFGSFLRSISQCNLHPIFFTDKILYMI
jgi:hypothetical protein